MNTKTDSHTMTSYQVQSKRLCSVLNGQFYSFQSLLRVRRSSIRFAQKGHRKYCQKEDILIALNGWRTKVRSVSKFHAELTGLKHHLLCFRFWEQLLGSIAHTETTDWPFHQFEAFLKSNSENHEIIITCPINNALALFSSGCTFSLVFFLSLSYLEKLFWLPLPRLTKFYPSCHQCCPGLLCTAVLFFQQISERLNFPTRAKDCIHEVVFSCLKPHSSSSSEVPQHTLTMLPRAVCSSILTDKLCWLNIHPQAEFQAQGLKDYLHSNITCHCSILPTLKG